MKFVQSFSKKCSLCAKINIYIHSSIRRNSYITAVFFLIQLSEVECPICCTQGRGHPARDKKRFRDVGILPAIKKKWMSMCTHKCCMPHGIAGVSVPRETGEVKGVVPRPWLRGVSAISAFSARPLRKRSGLWPTKISAFSAISARP